MKLLLFGGFVGSGKTSLILQLARYISNDTSSPSDKTRLAIIENEIGQTGIDDLVIREAGFEVRSLFAGCICCQLTSDLIGTLCQLDKEYSPEYVVVEASGLAEPSNIIDSIKKYCDFIQKTNSIIVVDCQRWHKLKVGIEPLLYRQLKSADQILLNKIDCVAQKNLNDIKDEIVSVFSRPIYCVAANEEIDSSIWESLIE